MNVIDFSSTTAWPVCPECKGHDLITAGALASCVSCSWIGSLKSFQKNEAAVYCMARAACLPSFEATYAQFGAFPQFAMPDFGNTLAAAKANLFAINNVLRYWDSARDYVLKHGSLKPMLLTWECNYGQPTLVQLGSKSESGERVLRNNAAPASMALVIYTTDTPGGHFLDPDFKTGDKWLQANIHAISVPPITVCHEVQELPKQWGECPASVAVNQPRDILWQAVDWQTLVSPRGRQQALLYASGFETKDGNNVTFAVHEDMDTGECVATGCVRVHGNPERAKVKDYAGQVKSVDDSLTVVSQKYKELSENKDGLVFQYELNFDIDRSPRSVVNEVQELPIWEQELSRAVTVHVEELRKSITSNTIPIIPGFGTQKSGKTAKP